MQLLRRSQPGKVRLRPAADVDVPELVTLWHDGWREVHVGHVPDELVAHRTPGALTSRMQEFVGSTDARGTGAAAALLTHGEERFRASGPFDTCVWSTDGEARIPVPVRRYEKRLA